MPGSVKIDSFALPAMDGMIWVDYCLIGLIGLSAVMGLFRGLIREVFSLALWGAAIWFGLQYSRELSGLLDPAIPVPSGRIAVAFLGVFIATLLLGSLLGFFLGKLVSGSGLSGTDRLAGLVFGVLRGVLIGSVLIMLAGVTPLPEDPWWKQSKLIPPFQTLALWLRNQLPADLASHIKFR